MHVGVVEAGDDGPAFAVDESHPANGLGVVVFRNLPPLLCRVLGIQHFCGRFGRRIEYFVVRSCCADVAILNKERLAEDAPFDIDLAVV